MRQGDKRRGREHVGQALLLLTRESRVPLRARSPRTRAQDFLLGANPFPWQLKSAAQLQAVTQPWSAGTIGGKVTARLQAGQFLPQRTPRGGPGASTATRGT